MFRSEEGSPRTKFFIEGQMSWESRIERSGKNLEARESRSISCFGSWFSSVFEWSCLDSDSSSSSSCCVWVVSGLGVASPASSLLSKTMRPVESIERWFSKSPLAPPSSKSADAFLNSGSTANSSSSFLSCRDANEGARVVSCDRVCAAVRDMHMRNRKFAVPFS